MDSILYKKYISILEKELIPSTGCTEPVAVAYCASLAAEALGLLPDRVNVYASANIIKNVKSVFVPNTGGLKGLEAAAAAGIISGRADKGLEVLDALTKEQTGEIAAYLKAADISAFRSIREYILDIEVEVFSKGHSAKAEIAGSHTNVIHIEKDGKVLFDKEYKEESGKDADYDLLNIEDIVEFAGCVRMDDVRGILRRQIDCNMAIAKEGLKGDYGANIGSVLLDAYGEGIQNRAKAFAAAASDARMSGLSMPVVINSGSGNQGITVSVPVIMYAKELGSPEDTLYRALIVSNLTAIHLKTGIGCLSAYCGATSAACGAAAGITYLYGGRFNEIAHTIVNAGAINSGMVCDGAKASCAAKIASAIEAGLLGMQMQRRGREFLDGEGIVKKGVENTIRNIGTLASEGMGSTDETIIQIMTGKKA